MGPLGSQGLIWSEVLCCPICNQIFSNVRVPVNLLCGHAVCLSCLHTKPKACPSDSVQISENVVNYPINTFILSILSIPLDSFADQCLSEKFAKSPVYPYVVEAEKNMYSLVAYLRVADSEKGGAVYSDLVSRTIQRKIISIVCASLTETEGRMQAMRAIRSLSERIVTELICVVQNTIHLSAYLWSAVRARGCQFLGPAMQEDVLRLILLTLANGELIARKTLVMYIVQTLSEDYPHVSKTCVGHVVQLLYRASCFNVIKRDGESSLMQLKDEFREYESLRREHDSQIVQIALEAGLRISPDQWSSLLYGDPQHRSHMQSIVDRLHSPQALSHALKELRGTVERNATSSTLNKVLDDLEVIAEMDSETDSSWKVLSEALALIEYVIYEYVSFNKKNNNLGQFERYSKQRSNGVMKNSFTKPNMEKTQQGFGRYKTKMCRDVISGKSCPRGPTCTYAHQQDELRADNDVKNGAYFNDAEPQLHENDMQYSEVPQQVNNIMHQPEVIPYPMVPIQHQQMMPENGSVMVDGNQFLMPMMMTNTINEIPAEQFHKMAQPVGMTTPIFVMHQDQMGNPTHPVIVQNPMQVVRHPPPPPPQQVPVNGYQYRLPQQGHIIGTPTQVVYPPWAQNYQTDMNHYAPPIIHQQQPQQMQQQQTPPQVFSVPNQNQQKQVRERNDSDLTSSSHSSEKGLKMPGDENSLIARRNEVISRLRGFEIPKDEMEEDAESHVSFTVANAVLFDDMDPLLNALDFPPIPIQPLANVPNTMMTAVITENGTSTVTWAYSLSVDQRTARNKRMPFVRTVCPTTLLRIDSTKPATVQSDCSVMLLNDAIDQPLVTATIQRNNLSPQASYDMVDPCQFTEQLPMVMQSIPLAPENPQDFVSSSIDRIINVREKINEERGRAMSSAVEKEQLKVELNIANRQLSTLDQQTKQTCLLKELKAIDEKIVNLGTVFSESNGLA